MKSNKSDSYVFGKPMKINRLRNLLFIFALIVFDQAALFAQAAQAQTELATYIKENYAKREVMIPMRDGVKLFTSIYEPLTPNTLTKLGFTMPGITHTFKKGHRIMVQIQSTWFPLVARNPQKYMDNYKLATAADFQKATERVYYGGKNSSIIVLPIIK